MLSFLNKKFQRCKDFLRRPLTEEKGQIAVILILLLAVALVFYAIALNLGRVAQIKTITTMASNLSAAQMASFMASYGEKIFQEQLGGKPKRCSLTGVFAAIVIVIIIIIAIIVSIVSWGSTAGIWAGIIAHAAAAVMLAVALVAALASLALQVVVLQPGLTKLWNKMMSEGLGPTDLIIERGIQTGLASAVTDQVTVPDFWDMDLNRKFGGLDDPLDPNSAPNYISRFGYYNTLRLRSIRARDMIAIKDFQTALNNFLYTEPRPSPKSSWCEEDKSYPAANCQRDPTNPDEFSNCKWVITGPNPTTPKSSECHRDFGLLDKTMVDGIFADAALDPTHPCADPVNPPAECDPCCVPQYAPNDDNPTVPACEQTSYPRNATCESVSGSCQWVWESGNHNADPADCHSKPFRPLTCTAAQVASCGNRSMFGSEFPFVYDPFYENSRNNDQATLGDAARLSFRELLGRDDENHKYAVNKNQPNWHWNIALPPTLDAKQLIIPAVANQGFFVNDVTGYWSAQPSFQPPQEQRGIYKFFYKMHDWGVETSPSVTTGLTYQKYQCQWCNGAVTCPVPLATCMQYLTPPDLTPISISAAPAPYNLPDFNSYAGKADRLDNSNTSTTGGPQRLDRLAYIPSLFTAEDTPDPNGACASGPTIATTFKGWKHGSDRYCAPVSPNPAFPAPAPFNKLYPYHVGCTKQGGVYPLCKRDKAGSCGGGSDDPLDYYQCGEGGIAPKLWPDDWMDEITYGLPEFFKYADNFINQRPGILAKSFADWYNEMADWIEPPCCSGGSGGSCTPEVQTNSSCDGSFTGLKREGSLYEWLREMKEFYNPINTWLSANNEGTACTGSSPDVVWCVPPVQTTPNEYGLLECPKVTGTITATKTAADHDYSAGEAATFDVNKNGVRGDIEDVLACMNWNLTDPTPIIDENTGATIGTASGNYAKFKACAEHCSAANCTTLPRPLVPGLTPFVEGSGDPAKLAALNACITVIDSVKAGIASNGGNALGLDVASLINSINTACNPLTALAGIPNLAIHWNTTFGGYDPIARFILDSTPPNPPLIPLTFNRAVSSSQPLRIRLQDFLGATIVGAPPTPSTDPLYFNLNFNRIDKSTGWTVQACSVPSPDLLGPCNPPGCMISSFRCPTTEAMVSCPGTPGYSAADILACTCSFQLRTFSGLLCRGVGSTVPFKQGNTYNCQVGASATDPGPTDVCPCPAVTVPPFGPNYNIPCAQALPALTATCSGTVPPTAPLPYCSRPLFSSDVYNNSVAADLTNPSDPNAETWASFEAAVRAAQLAEKDAILGSCADTALIPPLNLTWKGLVQRAAADAKIQTDKMQKRYTFLQGLYSDAKSTAGTLKYGIDYFTKFLNNGTPYDEKNLDSPAELLISARKKLKNEPGTASTALYVWQDPPPKPPRVNPDGTDNFDGYWHAVKVEVRIPSRCNNSCGRIDSLGNSTEDPEWPHVKTYTKSWGMRRCYELDGRFGTVKARVIRYDQNHDPKQLTFPGGKPIWDFRTQHPDAQNQAIIGNITDLCRIVKIDRDPAGNLIPLVDEKIYQADGGDAQSSLYGWRNAFMINRSPKTDEQLAGATQEEKDNEPLFKDCWIAVHEQMIEKGVATDTCAEYYYNGSTPKGFRIKFIKCDKQFSDGAT